VKDVRAIHESPPLYEIKVEPEASSTLISTPSFFVLQHLIVNAVA